MINWTICNNPVHVLGNLILVSHQNIQVRNRQSIREEKHTSLQITNATTGPKQEPSPHILQEAKS